MQITGEFSEKLRQGRHCLGTCISFSDPTPNHAAEHAVQALDGRAKVSTPYQQAEQSDALVLAIHWEDLDSALAALCWLGVDVTRPLLAESTRPVAAESGEPFSVEPLEV